MCDENLLKLWKLVGFQKILIQNVLAIFSKKTCYYYYYFVVENFEPVNYFKKTLSAFLFEKPVGFSCKDLDKFSKNLSIF